MGALVQPPPTARTNRRHPTSRGRTGVLSAQSGHRLTQANRTPENPGRFSQSGPEYWAQILPDRVAADSIVNRLANNARKINLGSIDMRKTNNQKARKNPNYWE